MTAALAVCACGYRPGSIAADRQSGRLAGGYATVGCLDVAVAGRWSEPVEQAVVIEFGNRCDRPVTVDFTALRAFGRDAGGRQHALVVHDPRREIRPLPLEARSAGREVLELRPPAPGAASAPRMRSTCVDVGRLASGAAGAALWLCVSRPRPTRSAEAS